MHLPLPLATPLCRAEDLRNAFERYGEIRDVYMPKDFHTGCVTRLTPITTANHLRFLRHAAQPPQM